MRILVTGQTGQVARALAAVNENHELIFMGRPHIDLASPASVLEPVLKAEPDAILSCAAHTHVDQCESEPDRAFRINANAPGVLADAAKQLDIPIIHLSTDYVFDGETSQPYTEADQPRPLNIYGASKLAGEEAVAGAAPRHAIVRVSWVYSQFSDNFLCTMLRLANNRSEIDVVSDQVSCPTSGLALAAALIRLAEQMVGAPDVHGYGVFHLAGGAHVSRADLAQAVMDWARSEGHASATIRPVASSAFPTPAKRPLFSAMNCERLQSVYKLAIPPWQAWLSDCLHTIATAPASGGTR